MSVICPTVTASTVDDFREQVETVGSFSPRIHIDLGDGIFTKRLIDIADVWWPETTTADIHLMYDVVLESLESLVALKPNMVILHAESRDTIDAIRYLQRYCITVGVSLLQKTSVSETREMIELCDHVLIFSGSLGSFGGSVDYSLLSKAEQIRDLRPEIEIGWDGGINASNARKLAESGIDVLNVGGAIQKANYPENAYRELSRQLYS